ncbi:DNA-binding transcriptional regulator, AcrR family [Paramicrobacterium humi]|uniref:DNA-binding transcriptional regulator, AcrR family n=2 Tax=Paramicrobacterium humi TaxID=640635 RepID=A0A1H4PF06_9MICO|nr:DNA-binding transcriptional regulator, AcrR family [Microbacterium humi]
MSAEDRREMILDVVVPLLLEHGTGVTSRQIAQAAGIAEGTIFRVFGDKDSVVSAAIDKYFDPEPFREQLRHISPEWSLDVKLRELIRLMRERFTGIFRLASVIGPRHPDRRDQRQVYASIVADFLAPDLERLTLPPVRVAHIVRLLTFASAFPMVNAGIEFDDAELAHIIMHGVVGAPRSESQG